MPKPRRTGARPRAIRERHGLGLFRQRHHPQLRRLGRTPTVAPSTIIQPLTKDTVMHNSCRVVRRLRQACPPAARTAAAVIATAAAIAMLVAACSGSATSAGFGGSSNAGGSSSSSSAVGYSHCMRSHGVPTFPDPDSSGQLPKADPHQLGVSPSKLEAARRGCQHLLPNTGGAINAGSVQQCMMASDCPQALVQHLLNEERRFALCMRSHGMPNWPDPIIDSQGRPVFAISISQDGFSPYSPPIWAKADACSHLMPALPGAPFQVSP